MRAAVFDRYGPPEVLRVEEVATPEPQAGEVRVRVRAASIITADADIRGSTNPLWINIFLRLFIGVLRPKRFHTLGQDFAGEVDAIGEGVTRFTVGDPVFGVLTMAFGTHAEYVCIKETDAIARKAENQSFEEAAGVCVGAVNALHFLRLANVQQGETVLINGGAGTIGHFAVQLAKHMGGEVTAIDAADKLDTMRECGADRVLDYREVDFTREGKSYDVIFDVIGTGHLGRMLRCLNPGGRLALANTHPLQMLQATWADKTTDKTVIYQFADNVQSDLDHIRDLIEQGALRSIVHKTFLLDDIVEAHHYIESGKKSANVIIKVG